MRDKVTEVPSVNSDLTIAELKRLSPAVVVVNGTRIIQEKVLGCVDAVFLNTHAGITPMYRGVHGGYWALASGDASNCGVTIHKVDKGIDTGSIVAQATISPSSRGHIFDISAAADSEGDPAAGTSSERTHLQGVFQRSLHARPSRNFGVIPPPGNT